MLDEGVANVFILNDYTLEYHLGKPILKKKVSLQKSCLSFDEMLLGHCLGPKPSQ